jgi:hypothetical protein
VAVRSTVRLTDAALRWGLAASLAELDRLRSISTDARNKYRSCYSQCIELAFRRRAMTRAGELCITRFRSISGSRCQAGWAVATDLTGHHKLLCVAASYRSAVD